MQQVEVMVRHLSKGLAQIINNRAEFIHQSVSDYVLQHGLQDLDSSIQGDAKGRAHFQISRSCIRYLMLQESRSYPYPE